MYGIFLFKENCRKFSKVACYDKIYLNYKKGTFSSGTKVLILN